MSTKASPAVSPAAGPNGPSEALPPRSDIVQDVASLERLMADVLPKLVSYRLANATPDQTKIVEYTPPKQLESLLLGAAAGEGGSAMPATAGSHDEVLSGIQAALDYSVRTGHPRFFDKLYAGSDSIGQVRAASPVCITVCSASLSLNAPTAAARRWRSW
jgi:hypothetical protein